MYPPNNPYGYPYPPFPPYVIMQPPPPPPNQPKQKKPKNPLSRKTLVHQLDELVQYNKAWKEFIDSQQKKDDKNDKPEPFFKRKFTFLETFGISMVLAIFSIPVLMAVLTTLSRSIR